MVSADNAAYAYNAQGLRVSKSVGNTTTSFLLVGGDVWVETTAAYLRGIELISNGTQLYLYNVRGDVIQLADLSGNVTKTYDYDAYGNEYARDLGDENPFRYCGEYYDTETGFIYLRARYYDPMVGRFTSVDPAKDGLNWYAYCGNDPDEILSIVISDKSKHQEITKAFRDIIGYAKDNKILKTGTATPNQIWDAIVRVYRDAGMDEYLSILKEQLINCAEHASKITDWLGV